MANPKRNARLQYDQFIAVLAIMGDGPERRYIAVKCNAFGCLQFFYRRSEYLSVCDKIIQRVIQTSSQTLQSRLFQLCENVAM